MRYAIKIYILLISSFFIFSCAYFERITDLFKDKPEIEGEGADDIVSLDIDLDPGGSDSGNIEGLRTVYFDFDSSVLKESDKSILMNNKKWLDSNPNVKRIIIEGHCDPLGSEVYNIGLGERRARSVLNYLKSLGLSEDKMTVVSYGEERPYSLVDNSLNRRVNFVPQY